MSPFIVSIFNSIAFVMYCYIGSHIILHKKYNKTKKLILAVVSLFAMYYLILCLLNSVYSIFFSGLSAYFFIKLVFKESIYMSLFVSVILNAIKIVIKVIILAFLNNDDFLLLNTYETLDLSAFYINLVAMVLAIILLLIFRKGLWEIIKYVSTLKKRKIVLLIAVYINFLLIYIYQPPYDIFCLKSITDFIIIIALTAIGILSISGEMKMESLLNHYNEIHEYSRANAELLNEYKMQVHENKNRLLMIKGMLDESDKKVIKYIDSVLTEMKEDKSNTNYWLSELQYIPFPGIRNFINYKLIRLKELGAEIEIFVSSELKKIEGSFLDDREYNQLTTILGVVLDNMIESTQEANEKLISINIYLEDNAVHGEFVNSFSGKVDFNRLNEIGYTTKGKQHGVGLPLVAKITRSNKRFECKPKIIDNFFTQHLIVKFFDKENLQKITQN